MISLPENKRKALGNTNSHNKNILESSISMNSHLLQLEKTRKHVSCYILLYTDKETFSIPTLSIFSPVSTADSDDKYMHRFSYVWLAALDKL